MSLRKVYEAYRDEGEVGDLARTLIDQQDWFASAAEFDPRTGYALPLGLDEVLRRLASPTNTTFVRDRLWRIVEHSRTSLERIFRSLRVEPRREQAVLPIRDVRELDAASFVALSRRPGRNIREKLAGKPSMHAVRRYQSVDLPENRLLKEYVIQLADLLELRAMHLGHEDELLVGIYRWLRSDEAQAIGQWGNVPPNNTLLSHKDYRRVWGSWRALQMLDQLTDDDLTSLGSRADTVAQWRQYADAYANGTAVFGDLPVLFDYDAFGLTPWLPLVADAPSPPIKRPGRTPKVNGPACVDLTTLHPRYSIDGAAASVMTESFAWQRWHGEKGVQDLELFEADAAIISPEATTLTWGDLATVTDETDPEVIGAAALAFTRRLAATFTHPALITLMPDSANDFQMEAIRRHINSRFAQAEPLPRSIAAATAQIDYSRIARDGFEVVVVDTVGAVTSATKLTAKHDPVLAARVPQTHGFYWERAPHVVLRSSVRKTSTLRQMLTVDDRELWYDPVPPVPGAPVSLALLRQNGAIGTFDHAITVEKSPVAGGMRLFLLQQAAGDIPMWRDQIPELSIKIFVGRRYEPFYLVHRGTTVRPVRGVPVPIPIDRTFTLPRGKDFYQFPLFQGSDSNDLGYVARLVSPDFPLATDTLYDLDMSYTYGADEPYRLVFRPRDPSFRPVQATWRLKTQEEITDAPAPEFPPTATWRELQEYFDAAKGDTTNYPDWAARRTGDLLDKLSQLDQISHGTIRANWKVDKNGKHFTFVEHESEDDVFVHESDFIGGTTHDRFSHGDSLYFVVSEHGGRRSARSVAGSLGAVRAALAADIAPWIRRALYVPYIRTWSDGRSLADSECPESFRGRMNTLLPGLASALQSTSTPRPAKNEIKFLFSCIHKDMPTIVSSQLAADLGTGMVDEKSLGFALGDLSQAWQQDLFRSLLAKNNSQALRVFARAIWRTEGFVRAFGLTDLTELVSRTLGAIKEASGKTARTKTDVAALTRYCELVLGLLRSRDSEDSEVRMVLQPHQVATKALAEQVERAATLLAQARFPIESRVQVASLPEKPVGDDTPDLLFALRLYLTGDVGANAIRVTGINDGEDD